MTRTLACLVLGTALIACSSGSGEPGANGNPVGPNGMPAVMDMPLAPGIQISEVAAYQVLKSSLMKDGQTVTDAVPVVADRPALVRVFVKPGATWQPREVTVRLELGTSKLEQRQLINAPSTDPDLASTINFELTSEQVAANTTWAVSIRETAPGAQAADVTGARYPKDGTQPLGASDTGKSLQVVVIPVQYMADGSGRMPDTGATQLEKLRAKMLSLYPVKAVDITVGAPFAWSQALQANGRGWGTLLDAIVTKRLRDGVASNVYYYGMFEPASSMEAFCGGGCVAGLSPTSEDPDDEYARGSIGLGYGGAYSDAAGTFVHEVGHAHGRLHAPCDVYDEDPDYPYADGKIGVWGYNADTKKLLDPNGRARDMMGYCDPQWISDYTYKALFERVSYLKSAGYKIGGAEGPTRWRSVVVDGDQAVRGELLTFDRPPAGRPAMVQRTLPTGSEQVTARFYPFDHLPGGLLLVPESADSGTLRYDSRTIK